MKVIKIGLLGLLIWSVGLLWPELNLAWLLAGAIGGGLALAAVAGLLYLMQLHGNGHHPASPSSRPSRPVAAH
jgi:hypothetical protein